MPWIDPRFANRSDIVSIAQILTFVLAFQIAPSPQAQQSPPPLHAPLSRPELPQIPSSPSTTLSVRPSFSVVIDAAHGGTNAGARIANNLLEKNVTLGLTNRLRSALAARGIAVVTTRESDTDPLPDERAGIANHAKASACLVLHATATGSGVHLFTSSLAPSTATASGAIPNLVSWDTVQTTWITRSLRLSSEINSAMGQAGIPVTLGSTSLQPLDHLACPALAVEIAPLAASPANKAAPLSDEKYQQRILDALVAAIRAWSADWSQQP
jgi:N-acetylmuramoyl-L-alanine amidase